MRRLLIFLLLLPLFTGCQSSYDWRDEHRGALKSISGYGSYLAIEFTDGSVYKTTALSESDPWKMGDERVLQSKRRSVFPGPPFVSWRLVSPVLLEPGSKAGMPAEKLPPRW